MDFLHPNLLTTANLKQILKERNLLIPNIDDLTKDELMRIYDKFALPLGQRNDKSNELEQKSVKKSIMQSPPNVLQISPNRIISLKRNNAHLNNKPPELEKSKIFKISPEFLVNDLGQKRENSCNDEMKLKRQKITWP